MAVPRALFNGFLHAAVSNEFIAQLDPTSQVEVRNAREQTLHQALEVPLSGEAASVSVLRRSLRVSTASEGQQIHERRAQERAAKEIQLEDLTKELQQTEQTLQAVHSQPEQLKLENKLAVLKAQVAAQTEEVVAESEARLHAITELAKVKAELARPPPVEQAAEPVPTEIEVTQRRQDRLLRKTEQLEREEKSEVQAATEKAEAELKAEATAVPLAPVAPAPEQKTPAPELSKGQKKQTRGQREPGPGKREPPAGSVAAVAALRKTPAPRKKAEQKEELSEVLKGIREQQGRVTPVAAAKACPLEFPKSLQNCLQDVNFGKDCALPADPPKCVVCFKQNFTIKGEPLAHTEEQMEDQIENAAKGLKLPLWKTRPEEEKNEMRDLARKWFATNAWHTFANFYAHSKDPTAKLGSQDRHLAFLALEKQAVDGVQVLGTAAGNKANPIFDVLTLEEMLRLEANGCSTLTTPDLDTFEKWLKASKQAVFVPPKKTQKLTPAQAEECIDEHKLEQTRSDCVESASTCDDAVQLACVRCAKLETLAKWQSVPGLRSPALQAEKDRLKTERATAKQAASKFVSEYFIEKGMEKLASQIVDWDKKSKIEQEALYRDSDEAKEAADASSSAAIVDFMDQYEQKSEDWMRTRAGRKMDEFIRKDEVEAYEDLWIKTGVILTPEQKKEVPLDTWQKASVRGGRCELLLTKLTYELFRSPPTKELTSMVGYGTGVKQQAKKLGTRAGVDCRKFISQDGTEHAASKLSVAVQTCLTARKATDVDAECMLLNTSCLDCDNLPLEIGPLNGDLERLAVEEKQFRAIPGHEAWIKLKKGSDTCTSRYAAAKLDIGRIKLARESAQEASQAKEPEPAEASTKGAQKEPGQPASQAKPEQKEQDKPTPKPTLPKGKSVLSRLTRGAFGT